MLRPFLRNTAISAVAYGAAGVLGLFSVGLIARSYGVTVLGLLVLVRAFLPSGFLALIDFGVSELATQAVARGRFGDWRLASEKVSLLTSIAASTGIISSLALWLASPWLAVVLKVQHEQVLGFVSTLHVTSLVLPICFVGLVVEGVLKGFEQYAWLRLTEVVSSLLYIGSIYLAAWKQAPFEWLAYAYLGTTVTKYLVLGIVVRCTIRGSLLSFTLWTEASRKDLVHRCLQMFNNRIAGTFQHTLPPLAIGFLFSPIEVGIYDLITRLPRFLKATMGPLYSAILPLSARIEETTDIRRLQILGRNGLVLPAAFVLPVLMVLALLSRQVLTVWVGPEHSQEWPWVAMSLLVPAITIQLGAGQTALMVKPEFLTFSTKLLYLQVLTQYTITLLTLAWFREHAFIFGWAISHVVFAPLLAYNMLAQIGLPNSLFWGQLSRHLVVGIILSGIVGLCKSVLPLDSLSELVILGSLLCLIALALSGAIVLTSAERMMFGRLGRALACRE
ncbi:MULTISPECIES: teichoic acid transporter [unclassified Bradyrhizobium]|uniref:lipopolysaccharide biosynthesis protein n=1 Tax=unclassified Bradyrhizobium TaxID=2631580 RepID=UPI001FFADD5F|nr:teichoic acid transporter [Bradyrhizobium sp. CW9]MCK1697505.1 teichoic acid transporter [Bradyrhizobium sp. 144]